MLNYGTALVVSIVKHYMEATMEKLVKMFEDLMVAVTFAEAGEFDEANRIARNELGQDEKSPVPAPATK